MSGGEKLLRAEIAELIGAKPEHILTLFSTPRKDFFMWSISYVFHDRKFSRDELIHAEKFTALTGRSVNDPARWRATLTRMIAAAQSL